MRPPPPLLDVLELLWEGGPAEQRVQAARACWRRVGTGVRADRPASERALPPACPFSGQGAGGGRCLCGPEPRLWSVGPGCALPGGPASRRAGRSTSGTCPGPSSWSAREPLPPYPVPRSGGASGEPCRPGLQRVVRGRPRPSHAAGPGGGVQSMLAVIVGTSARRPSESAGAGLNLSANGPDSPRLLRRVAGCRCRPPAPGGAGRAADRGRVSSPSCRAPRPAERAAGGTRGPVARPLCCGRQSVCRRPVPTPGVRLQGGWWGRLRACGRGQEKRPEEPIPSPWHAGARPRGWAGLGPPPPRKRQAAPAGPPGRAWAATPSRASPSGPGASAPLRQSRTCVRASGARVPLLPVVTCGGLSAGWAGPRRLMAAGLPLPSGLGTVRRAQGSGVIY